MRAFLFLALTLSASCAESTNQPKEDDPLVTVFEVCVGTNDALYGNKLALRGLYRGNNFLLDFAHLEDETYCSQPIEFSGYERFMIQHDLLSLTAVEIRTFEFEAGKLNPFVVSRHPLKRVKGAFSFQFLGDRTDESLIIGSQVPASRIRGRF